METLTSFSLDEILLDIPYTNTKTKRVFTLNDGRSFDVKLHTVRLRLFKRSTKCACCGIEGSHFHLERFGNESPHLNLYANDNGKLVLMTKDHIIPASHGGSDSIDNMQTMCSTCNQLKSNWELTLEELKQVRNRYDDLIKSGVKNKKALQFVENFKIELYKKRNNK